VAVVVLILDGLASLKTTADVSSVNENLRGKIHQVIAHCTPRGGVVGVHAVDLETGEELASYNANRLFTVASNMKLLTTAAAMTRLGPSFEFVTTVRLAGRSLGNGIWQGNLIVQGTGDPNISGRFHDGDATAIFREWASALLARGVRRITGDLVVDDSAFDAEFVHPDWPKDQLYRWWCAPVCALSFNDNCIAVNVRPAKAPGQKALVALDPPTHYATVRNTCKTTSRKSKHAIAIERKPGSNEIKVFGKTWIKASPYQVDVTVEDPALYFGTVLRETLENRGVRVEGKVRRPRQQETNMSGATVVVRFASRLDQSVAVANKRSQNFYAEQMLKALGRQENGVGSFGGGLEVLRGLMLELGYKDAEVNEYVRDEILHQPIVGD